MPVVNGAIDFLQGGGAVGALMREHDWSDSPLGSPAAWPQPLRTATGLLLQSRFPMFVAWGDALGFLYNDAYAEILGAKHPSALGRPFQAIWSEIWSDISPLIEAALAGQAIYREDLPLVIHRKGYDEQAWFTFSYSSLRDESGAVAGMFCAVSETTKRVLAERALRDLNDTLERRVNEALAQRKLLADIVEGTNAFVQVADLEYRWLAINRAAADEFERLFGVRPRVGASMLEHLAAQPEHQAAVKAVWSRALAGEEFVEVGEFGDATRRRVYEMRYNNLRDGDGRRVGAYQFVYDVTQRVRDEQRLRKAEEALGQSRKLEAMGRLTGGVAHDFNNLLAVFSNGLHLLEHDASAHRRERVCAAMRRAVTRGTGLTHQLLAFTRRQAINPQSTDIANDLKGMREMLERSLPAGIRLEMAFADALWPVEIDVGEFELAMLNLLANARDAMPEGGVIRIEAGHLEGSADDAGPADSVQLSITDTGSGMPPEVLDRVFEPFFTTKDVGKGSGLGLPQVYGFVQQSGGQIRIDSQVDAGTTVTLLLPRSSRMPTAPAEAANTPVLVHGERNGRQVLLVEDDFEVTALTREMLSHLGFQVIHTASANAALGALANARNIDLVFSDIVMPGSMSGLELAREIRRRQPGLPIVLTTGNPGAAAEMRNAEFRLLLKPYSIESLAEALGVEAR